MNCLFVCVVVFLLISKGYEAKKEEQDIRWKFIDDSSGQTCILVEFDAKLNISYTKKDGISNGREVYTIPFKNSEITAGDCGDGASDQNVTIKWNDPQHVTHKMELQFKFFTSTHLYSLYAIAFEINTARFEDGANHTMKYLYIGDDFWAPDGWSYKCTKPQTIALSSENRLYIMGSVEITNIRFEATLTENIEELSIPMECRVDDFKTKAVMIIVGGVGVLFFSIGVYIYFHRLRL